MSLEEKYLTPEELAYYQLCKKTAERTQPINLTSGPWAKLQECERDLQPRIDIRKAKVVGVPGTKVTIEERLTEIDLIPFPFATGDSNIPVGILDNMRFRVFVMGVEISDYLDNISWTHDASAEMIGGTANINLSVPRDLLTFTEKNLTEGVAGEWEIAENNQASFKAGSRVNWVISSDFRVSEKAKKELYDYKSVNNFYDRSTVLARWNLAPNTLCIHHGDTVRIFAHIPWSRKDAWLPVFTGYVREPSLSRNTNGVDKISFSCYTLAEKLTKARVLSRFSATICDPKTTASQLGDSKNYLFGKSGVDVVDMNNAFQDSLSGSWATPLLNTTLEGLLRYLFYGDLGKLGDGPGAKFTQKIGDLSAKTLSTISAYQRAIEDYQKKQQGSSPEAVAKAKQKVDDLKSELSKTPGVLDQNGNVIAGGDKTRMGSAANDFRSKRSLGFLTDDLFVNMEFPISGTITYTKESLDENQVFVNEASKEEAKQMRTCEKDWPVGVKNPEKLLTTLFGVTDRSHAKPHTGLDIAVPPTKLIAPINCWVLEIYPGVHPIAGRYLRVLGEDGYVHGFMHLSEIDSSLRFGRYLKKGTRLGMTGGKGPDAGHSTGNHLHWEVWKWNKEWPNWDAAPPKAQRGGLGINPLIWLKSKEITQGKSISSGNLDTTQVSLTQVDKSSIDWTKEVDAFEAWKACCLVGWANGLSEDHLKTSNDSVDSLRDLDPKESQDLALTRGRVYLKDDEVTVIGKNSGWLGPFSPHGQQVSVVIRTPKAGWGINPGFVGGNEDLNIQDTTYQAGIQTKAQILITLLERVDYYWHITGNGDIVFEFPNYEMLPDHYGAKFKKEYSLSDIIQNDTIKEEFQNLKSTYVFVGSMSGIYSDGSATGANRFTQISYKLPTVATRNGIEIEEKFWPFITDIPRLSLFGAIYLRKQIANSHKYSTSDLPPLLYITPNTPVYLKDIDCYALARSITFTANIASASFKANIEFTAVRQKLTAEQLYLRANSEKVSNGETVLRNQLETYNAALQANSLANLSLSEKLQDTLSKYGYIFGAGDLLVDYSRLCSQNINIAKQYQVEANNNSERQENFGIAVFESNSGRLTSTPRYEGDGLERPPKGETHFSNAVEPSEEVKAAVVEACAANGLPAAAGSAMLAHGNVKAAIQPNWFDSISGWAKNLKSIYDKGVGFLALTSNVIGQVASVAAAVGNIVTTIKQTVGMVSNASGNLNSAVRSLRLGLNSIFGSSVMAPEDRARLEIKYDPHTQTKTSTQPSFSLPQPNIANQDPTPYVALDPRTNVKYSAAVAAVIMKETVKQISLLHGTTTNLQASEIHPDILGMALQFGPKDPAFRKTIKEVNPTDTSDSASDLFARKLQQNLYLLGGYSKADLNYCDFYRRIRKDAKKRGMHRLE